MVKSNFLTVKSKSEIYKQVAHKLPKRDIGKELQNCLCLIYGRVNIVYIPITLNHDDLYSIL